MIVVLFLSFAIAMLAGMVLIRWAHDHASRYRIDMPQRFHVGHVPRLGGASLLLGMLVGWVWIAAAATNANVTWEWTSMLAFVGAVLPAILGGIGEDLTQRLSVRNRLWLTLLSSALASWWLGLSVPRLGLPWVDEAMLALPWLGVAVAMLAICGLPHAFNIIDGYNGLAGVVALLVCLAVAHVALQVGDRQLAAMVLCLAGATGGFLVWNYPKGMLFAGDGGAYLWGVVIAIAVILLVQRHAQVSPWFPMLLLIYPVWETIFSSYRKFVRGVSPGVADALHFHQLIYRRIVRSVFHDDESRRMLMRNNRTSPYLWGFTLLTVAPAVVFWNNTPVLMACCGLFVVSYVAAYIAIVRFKVPDWLRR
jgi:UDP-N-acetylmuramyl pentapeptide phosphotransferase/UDP-N-acetylglucosamine-1-phosphate transferase